MVRRSIRGAAWALSLWVSLFGLFGALGAPARAQGAPAPGTPAPSAPPLGPAGSPGMDVKSGRVDMTPLFQRPEMDPSGAPMMPPQTVEGTLVSRDQAGHVITVRTERNGDVKIGLPPDLVPWRHGKESTLDAVEPGDRVYATVETTYGVRAVKLVSEAPVNPLLNIIGIPVLLLVALAIWWTGRGRGEVLAEPKAAVKSANKP